jgi:aspartate aminotransferase-like enzyme
VKVARQNLRTPGPTPVPQDIVQAMGEPMINHRGPEFHELIDEVTQRLKQVFMTQNDLYILTSSGTGALEAAVVNTLSPGDKVLGFSAGAFGDRFCDCSETFGAEVKRVNFEWGESIDPEVVRQELKDNPEVKAVQITHNETSTGITHDVETISRIVTREFGKLLLVDAVSSLGCIPLPVDGWGCDVVATASQKGFMMPPGLAFITMSAAAHEAQKTATMPKFYFDLAAAQRYLERGQTPWTPNVAAFFGLRLALDKMLEEGMEGVFTRHTNIARFTRDGVRSLGLELLCTDERRASDTVTAIKIPDGVDASTLMSVMRTEENVVLAEGQGKLAGKTFRIGHLGYVSREDIEEVLDALKRTLPEVGFKGS